MLRKEIKRKMKRGMDRMAELEGFLDRLLGELGECQIQIIKGISSYLFQIRRHRSEILHVVRVWDPWG